MLNSVNVNMTIITKRFTVNVPFEEVVVAIGYSVHDFILKDCRYVSGTICWVFLNIFFQDTPSRNGKISIHVVNAVGALILYLNISEYKSLLVIFFTLIKEPFIDR